MFRFSIDRDAPITVNPDQLATAGITPDEDFQQRLADTDSEHQDEIIYRVENEEPSSFAEAIEYVQGVLQHAPRRIWIDGEGYDVTDKDLANVEPPTA
jgi:hypothetical protein